MKYFTAAVVFVVFTAYFSLANSKSLKSFYGNNLTAYKAQRKPLASPVANGIHDSYTRSKRQTPKVIRDFQDLLTTSKKECVEEMGVSSTLLSKSLLYEENPTVTEKCLMSCILKKAKLMDKTNKLSTQSIARIAGNVSNNNPLIVSVAVATANNCNNLAIPSSNDCDAAAQINKCIAGEMKAHKLKLYY